MIRLLLVEHPPAVRRTLCDRLSIERDMTVAGETGDLSAAGDLAETLHPDVVLLDAEMPHLDVRNAVRILRARSPSSAVVILSLDTAAVSHALPDFAAIVVGKHQGTAGLLTAIRCAADGRHDS